MLLARPSRQMRLLVRSLFTLALAPALALAAAAQNVIQTENARTGTTDWVITNIATTNQIEGYASLTSVNRGGQIGFYVRSVDPSYSAQVFRLGWYGGLGGRSMGAAITLPAQDQPLPSPDPVTGLIECTWAQSFSLTVPNDADHTVWPSGIYVVKLTGSVNHFEKYIVFAVRDDARASDLFFQSSVNTFQAYNNWGGKSLYDFNSTGPAAVKVSFNRPYDEAYGTPDGAGQFLSGWEYNMVRFLEREGYDVTYGTDLDVHEKSTLLNNHKVYLSVGHDEYWSWQMRSNVTAARDRGVGLGFFSSNTSFWQVRFEPSLLTSAANRTMVGYKYNFTQDPYFTDTNRKNDYLVTTKWRLSPVNKPEAALLGVMDVEADNGGIYGDIVISDASNPIFALTGVQNGDHLVGLLGYEVDRIAAPYSPANIQQLAHSPFVGPDDPNTYYSDMALYSAASGATVFATGSMQWSWGLDNYLSNNDLGLHANLESPAAQQITRNVLARLIDRAPTAAITYTSNKATVSFSGLNSSDPDGFIASYAWNFGDGGTSTSSTPVHTFATARTYTVTLTVTDNGGATRSAQVNVKIRK